MVERDESLYSRLVPLSGTPSDVSTGGGFGGEGRVRGVRNVVLLIRLRGGERRSDRNRYTNRLPFITVIM